MRGSHIHRGAAIFSSLLALLLVGASSALAAAPTTQRIEINESFDEPFLTDTCGVPVTGTAEGFVIERTFDDGTGVALLTTINIALTFESPYGSKTIRDVGADLVRVEPDGTELLYVIGQLPFDFAGVLIIDLETDEGLLVPRDRSDEQLEKVCSALSQ